MDRTGVVFDQKMEEYFCHWDPSYVEEPGRWRSVIDRCTDLGLIERCHRLKSRPVTAKEIEPCHSKELVQILENTASMGVEQLKKASSQYDCLYIHENSWEAAQLSAGGGIDLSQAVLDGHLKNGMGILRPPGHHAMYNESCGYCYLNNVALAASHALERGAKKIVIVDWDVHHGQGTQRQFYNDNRVLYISIHRYEHGFWWPNLRESEYDAIGEGKGRGFNINLPLNVTGNTNSDYLAFWHSIVLPVILEFSPDLTLISAGYDPAVGCPEGEQNVTPACFAHFTQSLMQIGNGKVVALLEGGYFLPSLAEGAALTLRTLLGDPTPLLLEGISQPNPSIKETILNVKSTLSSYWTCFGDYAGINPTPPLWKGPDVAETAPYDIMCPTPARSESEENHFKELVKSLISETTLRSFERKIFCSWEEDNTEGYQTGLALFNEYKVQTLVGVTGESVNLPSSVHIMFNNTTDGQTINLADLSRDDVFGVQLAENPVLDCSQILSSVNTVFQVLLPLLYRVNPQNIKITIDHQTLEDSEASNLKLMFGQLQSLAGGRKVVFVSENIKNAILDIIRA